MDIHFRIVRTSIGFAIQVKRMNLYWDTIEKYYIERPECYNSFIKEMATDKKDHKLIEHSEIYI